MSDHPPGSWAQRARVWCLPGGRRPSAPAALVAVVIVFASSFLSRPLLRRVELARIGSTSGVQFEQAVNWVLCGRYGQITSAFPESRRRLNLAEIRDASDYDRSVIDLIERSVGHRFAYCAEPSGPFVAPEEGMMLIHAAALKLGPRVSLKGLAQELAACRLVLIGIFAWFLVREGYSLVFISAIVALAVYLTMLQGGHALYSAYPFILPVLLAGIGGAGFALGVEAPWVLPASCFGLGSWAGFLGNLRTSHYPMALLLIGLTIAWSGASWKRTIIAGLAAVSGLFMFDYTLMAPLRRLNVDINHPVAHALVLGLSHPPSSLSQREGIVWDDSVGPALARRVNPAITGLEAPGYESALFTYYQRLWRAHPREMADIYRRKLVTTGESLFAWLSETRGSPFWDEKNGSILALSGALVRPLSTVFTLGGVMLLLVTGAIVLRRSLGKEASWPLAAIGAAGFLGFLEASMILGSVALWYNAVLVYATLFAALLPYELVLAAVTGRAIRRATHEAAR